MTMACCSVGVKHFFYYNKGPFDNEFSALEV